MLVVLFRPQDDVDRIAQVTATAGLALLCLTAIGVTAMAGDLAAVALVVAIGVAVAFLYSVGRLVRLLIAFAEAIFRHRIEQWAERHGVDPDDIINNR